MAGRRQILSAHDCARRAPHRRNEDHSRAHSTAAAARAATAGGLVVELVRSGTAGGRFEAFMSLRGSNKALRRPHSRRELHQTEAKPDGQDDVGGREEDLDGASAVPIIDGVQDCDQQQCQASQHSRSRSKCTRRHRKRVRLAVRQSWPA